MATQDSKGGGAKAGDNGTTDHVGEMPKVDFSTFVLSLGTTALYQLGLVEDPSSGEKAPADPLVGFPLAHDAGCDVSQALRVRDDVIALENLQRLDGCRTT